MIIKSVFIFVYVKRLKVFLFQYQEADRNYGGRRQDVLRGQFVEVAQQQEADAEYVDDPVPVVIRGEYWVVKLGSNYFYLMTWWDSLTFYQ